MLQSWRFVVMWLTLPDPGLFIQALFLPPGTIPDLDAKIPGVSRLGRGDREKGLSLENACLGRRWEGTWGAGTGRMACRGPGLGCGLRAPWKLLNLSVLHTPPAPCLWNGHMEPFTGWCWAQPLVRSPVFTPGQG